MSRLSVTILALSALVMSQASVPAAAVAAQPQSSGAVAERPEQQRTFAEPLVAVGAPRPEETRQLAAALERYRAQRDVEAVQPVTAFLAEHPDSAWKPSLLANLAVLYRHTGYIDRALAAAGEAWRLTRSSTEPDARTVADTALATYLDLTAALGRTEELQALLTEVRGRRLRGRAADAVSGSWASLWQMRAHPGDSFRCGPLAVERVAEALHPGRGVDPRLLHYPSTRQGTSLAEIGRLAHDTGLDLAAVRRESGSAIPVPAVVHWKADHFAAIVAQEGDRFLAKDLTFGEDRWVSRAAVEAESSGYMLVARQAVPRAGWRSVGEAEAARVHGKGVSANPNPGSTGDSDPKLPDLPGDCGSGSDSGMPVYDFHTAVVSLNVTDTPVGYVPPRGPAVPIGITYNSREDFQPATFDFTNLGSRWSFNWLSYVEDDDPNNSGETVRQAERGGGSLIVPHVAGMPSGTYGPAVRGYHQTIVRTLASGATVGFVVQYPDGSQDVYGQSDNAATMRKYFLTAVSDTAGNTVTLHWDAATSRLLTITDALGQQTTLAYQLAGDIYKVTAVTDPFGRQAAFQYAGGELASVTDAVGVTSSFAYGPAVYDGTLAPDFMNALTTPYGTTTFDMAEHPPANLDDIGNVRWLLATDAAGNQKRIEFIHEAAGITRTTTEAVPAGFLNNNLNYRNTFYWNQTAMQSYDDNDPNRYLNATVELHWLRDLTGSEVAVSSILESEQAQGQHRLWFGYPNQPDFGYQGSLSAPTVAAQVLDSGQQQVTARTYDSSGRIQQLVDPAGRTYSFLYAANGIDVAAVRNPTLNGGNGEQIAAYTYNSSHRPLTFTDYSGAVHSATYNSFGQMTSLTRPDGAITNLTYDAQGFLQQVARAGTSLQESYTYDTANRVRTWTSTDGYTLTFSYDNLDRLTAITYPDGTSDSVAYFRRDVILFQDRMGRLTSYQYDAADRLVKVIDPANRATNLAWCACGALAQIADPLGHLTSWQRDGLNRVIAKQINGQATVFYAYDGAGRLARRTDALNQVTSYDYNVDDTLAGVTYQNAVHPTANVAYLWDPFYPRLALMSDGFGTTSYTYNPAGVAGAGQVASIAAPAPNHTVTFQYDVIGRRIARTVDGVAVATTYDALDRPATVTSPLGTFTAAYDGSSSRLTSLSYPNGQGPTFSYLDAAHDFRLSELRYGPAANSFNLSQFDYSYDAAHDQITGLAWHDLNNQSGRFFSFGYDAAKQLTGRQQTTDPTQSPVDVLHNTGYGYDLAGNRTSETIDASVTAVTFNGANQVVAVQNGLALQAQAAMDAARARSAQRPPGAAAPPGGAPPPGGPPPPRAQGAAPQPRGSLAQPQGSPAQPQGHQKQEGGRQ
jgi:YD repeat-containing protein